MIIQSEEISLKHLLTVEALTDQEVMGLIHRAQQFKQGARWTPHKDQYFVSNLFFENSTRTHKSFEVAEKNSDWMSLTLMPKPALFKKGKHYTTQF